MIRAVLDTNVLASAIIGVGLPSSVPGDLLRRWRRRQYSLIVSEHILAELARTLASPYFRRHIDAAQLSRLLQVLRRRADMTPIATLVTGVASHPEDDLILSAAVSARADYLVTGDQQLQRLRRYQGVVILSPRAFLTLLEGLSESER